jgi:hypothetical protein
MMKVQERHPSFYAMVFCINNITKMTVPVVFAAIMKSYYKLYSLYSSFTVFGTEQTEQYET